MLVFLMSRDHRGLFLTKVSKDKNNRGQGSYRGLLQRVYLGLYKDSMRALLIHWDAGDPAEIRGSLELRFLLKVLVRV